MLTLVVIGGRLITGGRAVPAGVWGGTLFFILLDGLLNLIGWDFAGQNVFKGFLDLAVLFPANGAPILGRRSTATEPLFANADEHDQVEGPSPPLEHEQFRTLEKR